jgi:tripartite-type tricarboxylate transporter receptor subunit TctC
MQIRNAGGEPVTSTPEQFAAYIKSEIARWGKAVKTANLPMQ